MGKRRRGGGSRPATLVPTEEVIVSIDPGERFAHLAQTGASPIRLAQVARLWRSRRIEYLELLLQHRGITGARDVILRTCEDPLWGWHHLDTLLWDVEAQAVFDTDDLANPRIEEPSKLLATLKLVAKHYPAFIIDQWVMLKHWLLPKGVCVGELQEVSDVAASLLKTVRTRAERQAVVDLYDPQRQLKVLNRCAQMHGEAAKLLAHLLMQGKLNARQLEPASDKLLSELLRAPERAEQLIVDMWDELDVDYDEFLSRLSVLNLPVCELDANLRVTLVVDQYRPVIVQYRSTSEQPLKPGDQVAVPLGKMPVSQQAMALGAFVTEPPAVLVVRRRCDVVRVVEHDLEEVG